MKEGVQQFSRGTFSGTTSWTRSTDGMATRRHFTIIRSLESLARTDGESTAARTRRKPVSYT
jgi:hypothetical protein